MTPELIKKVKSNKWNPDLDLEDKDARNALAARGYYEAFQEVKKSVEKILNKKKQEKYFFKIYKIGIENYFYRVLKLELSK